MSEERLAAIESKLDAHSKTLAGHTKTLDAHTATLDRVDGRIVKLEIGQEEMRDQMALVA